VRSTLTGTAMLYMRLLGRQAKAAMVSSCAGVGLAKRPLLPLEIAPVSLKLQRGIKNLLDPNNILNPGKLFPDAPAAGVQAGAAKENA